MGTQEDNTTLFCICYYCVYGGGCLCYHSVCLAGLGCCPYLAYENWWVSNACEPATIMTRAVSKFALLTKPLTTGPRSHLSIPEPPIHRCVWGPTMTWKTFHVWNHSTKLVGANSRGKTRSRDPRTSRMLSKTSHVPGVTWRGVTWRQPSQGLLWSLSCGHGEGAGFILRCVSGRWWHAWGSSFTAWLLEKAQLRSKRGRPKQQIRETQRVPKHSGLRI